MDDISFLLQWPAGNVTFTFEALDGRQTSIAGLDRDIFSTRCALLSAALVEDDLGRASLTLSVASHTAGVALVRYLYLGDYIVGCSDQACDPEFLIHAQVLQLADSISCSELGKIATGHLNYNVELAISFPTSPPDLVQTLIFLYTHLPHFPELLDSMLNYCVAAFTIHRLGEDAQFKHFAKTHESFLSDLSKTNASRDFENADIPKMDGPVRSPVVNDTDIANLFADHLIELEPTSSRPSTPPSPADMDVHFEKNAAPLLRELPIRIKTETELEGAEPASPASPATDDGFVLVDGPATTEWPAMDESDSEWSVV